MVTCSSLAGRRCIMSVQSDICCSRYITLLGMSCPGNILQKLIGAIRLTFIFVLHVVNIFSCDSSLPRVVVFPFLVHKLLKQS